MSAHNRNRIFVYIWTNCLHERWIVTRQSVNSFDELYELGPARRHKCENGTRIYCIFWMVCSKS